MRIRFESALWTLLGFAAIWAAFLTLRGPLGLGDLYIIKSLDGFAVISLVVLARLPRHHPFERFGAANTVTTIRAVLGSLVFGAIGEPATSAVATAAVAAGTLAALLDGVDGWVARRARMESSFGARFDMEVDAVLILALSILCWEHHKAGWWVIASGLLRYAFVAAGWRWSWLAQPLPPSRRRQTICVVQIVSLLFVLSPIVTVPASTIIAAAALALLSFSFAVDVIWLWRHLDGALSEQTVVAPRPWIDATLLAAALLLLNASLAFRNVWPTPMVHWTGDLSIEFAVAILIRAGLARWFRLPSRSALRALTVVWLLLVVGHYADVTAPALYGRAVNLYWDLRFVPDVAALLVRAGPQWLAVAAILAVILILWLLYSLLAWALDRVWRSLASPRPRRALTALASAVLLLFVAQTAWTGISFITFASPVSRTYARQLRLVAAGLRGSASIEAGPPIDSDLSRLHGADVYLIFLESYGVAAFDRPELAGRLAASRAAFAQAIRATNRHVVSAFVESPTFGGSSWLAHISLMSGVEVRAADTNAMLMTQKRETLVTAFARAGYRTVALMPGLWQRWPEGAFYGFDDIYGASRLDYHGPEFGWFDLTDQFALARLDALESARPDAKPLFVFFPTISTHTPFTPTPPYQANWKRMLSDEPYDAADLQRAYVREPDWMDLGPSYVEALAYAYATLGGYLRQHADRDLVMILLGDHQPPALVSGEGATWEVPVHVIAGRRDVLEQLRAHGFTPGIEPSRQSLGRLHALLPTLLDAFGNHRPF